MKEIINKALKELNQEGLLNGLKITDAGKREVEGILKTDGRAKELILKVFLKKLENDFYETDFIEFCYKVLFLENLLKKSGINLFFEIENLKNSKKF